MAFQKNFCDKLYLVVATLSQLQSTSRRHSFALQYFLRQTRQTFIRFFILLFSFFVLSQKIVYTSNNQYNHFSCKVQKLKYNKISTMKIIVAVVAVFFWGNKNGVLERFIRHKKCDKPRQMFVALCRKRLSQKKKPVRFCVKSENPVANFYLLCERKWS